MSSLGGVDGGVRMKWHNGIPRGYEQVLIISVSANLGLHTNTGGRVPREQLSLRTVRLCILPLAWRAVEGRSPGLSLLTEDLAIRLVEDDWTECIRGNKLTRLILPHDILCTYRMWWHPRGARMKDCELLPIVCNRGPSHAPPCPIGLSGCTARNLDRWGCRSNWIGQAS